jgi:prepilin-type processing-associated H-X9-DG protein
VNCGGLANSNLSGASLFASILPYIEQSANFEQYDFNQGNTSVYNQAVAGQQIEVYLCPTASIRRGVPGCDADSGRAPGTYAANIGSRDYNQYWSFTGAPRPELNGPLVYTDSTIGKTKMASVLDGTSSTLMIGETTYNLPDYLFSSGNCVGQSRYSFTYWINPFPGSTACTTEYGYNPKDIKDDGIFDPNWTRTFRSDHTGGAQFLLVDGSVHFVSENIDAETLDALATRDGREPKGQL